MQWHHWGADHPRLAIALSLALVALLGLGATRLSFDPRYATFFEPDDPQLVAFQHLRDQFAPSDSVVFVIDPGPGGAFDANGLEMLQTLTERAWKLPFVIRVDSPTNYPDSSADGDDVRIGPLLDQDASTLTAAQRARIEQVARSAPELAGLLVEPDGRFVAVSATVIMHGDPLAASQKLMDAARALAADIEQRWPAVSIHIGGIVAMNHAFSESSLGDSATLIPLMLLLMAAGLMWLLGAAPPVLSIMLVMVVSVVGALGAVGWMGLVLTTPTALAPIIIVTVAIADGVHLVLGQRASSLGPHEGLHESLDENVGPILLTTATTAAGFLSMNFSAVPPFRDLGNVVALGVLLAGVLSLTLLPALMELSPPTGRLPRFTRLSMAPLVEWMLRRRRALAVVLGLSLLAVLPGLARLQVNDDFVGYFDPDLPFRQAAELSDAHLAGMYEIEYQLSAPTAGGIHDPAWLAQVQDFTEWLRAQPETAHVLAWTDVLQRLNRTLNGDDPAFYRLPADAATAAQYTLLYELSLPLGLDLTNMIAPDYGSVRQVVDLRNMDSRRVLAFEARASGWLADHAPLVSERHGGINLMFAHISERNVRAMIDGNLLAVAVIAFMLAWALRSPALAFASMLTNLLPVAAAFAIWGWLVQDVGLALSTALGMTLGIVVDDTVHLLARYRRARGRGEVGAVAVRSAMLGVGPALVITTVILLIGFACLAASSFALNGLLARITMLTIALALVFDLLALPILLGGRPEADAGSAGRDSPGTGG